ncbi:uncharacterized protein LOC131893045 [Tigriopus californicus]|uniref:uncharacterized protein LOC131893045 n=1 Tax=Tigriopus californicus TaxID=6832 RepID=UPI0027DA4252|nr:uncharacterized protein LOC131893045 [Tigriopus californicus]
MTNELYASQAELEIVGPIWQDAICQENPLASADQIKAMLALKLQEAAYSIPVRRVAEKGFKDEVALCQRTLDSLRRVILVLQNKEGSDLTARIEFFQASATIDAMKTSRLPNLESCFQDVTQSWFKPSPDPLTETFSDLADKFSHLAALLDYERTMRPAMKEPKEDSDTTVSRNAMTMVQFDATKLIGKRFGGDLRKQSVLQNFSNWKSSWVNLVNEMKTLRGYNSITLFQKLKDSLVGPAHVMVSKYSCESVNSYDAAMQDLLDKFEDPIELAGSYIASAVAPHVSQPEHAEAIGHAFNALHNMRDVFERAQVGMYDFALMRTFVTSMSLEAQAQWKGYKMAKKQEYRLKWEAASKAGDSLPEWKEGMVECHDQFQAWLKLQTVRVGPPTIASELPHDESVSSASNFAIAVRQPHPARQDCILCGQSHRVNTCPKGLAMSRQQWSQMCRAKSICYRCIEPFTPEHHCQMICRVCQKKHHILMCPSNKFRTQPLGDIQDRSRAANPGMGNKRSRTPVPMDPSVAKWAKTLTDKLQNIENQINKGSAKNEKFVKRDKKTTKKQ